MKEWKILGVLVIFTAILYIGVEPYAHSVMHPHVAPEDYKFTDLHDVKMKEQGNVKNGETLVQSNCIGCHGLEAAGMSAPMDKATSASVYGVVPPDISTAGLIYDKNYLAHFIKNPAKASKLEHKFNAQNPHPMPNYEWMSDEEINDMVAYLVSVAPSHIEDKKVFEDACARCHSMRYDKVNAHSDVTDYMGSYPPDLSIIIRARSKEFLNTFINDPQKQLHGTAMPRVGLSEEAQAQVMTYLENIGDSKKQEREELAPWVLGYLVILAIFAYLWKVKIWREVH